LFGRSTGDSGHITDFSFHYADFFEELARNGLGFFIIHTVTYCPAVALIQ
jgi:hypothetical protein